MHFNPDSFRRQQDNVFVLVQSSLQISWYWCFIMPGTQVCQLAMFPQEPFQYECSHIGKLYYVLVIIISHSIILQSNTTESWKLTCLVFMTSFSQSLLELCNVHCFPEKMALIFLHFHQCGILVSKKKKKRGVYTGYKWKRWKYICFLNTESLQFDSLTWGTTEFQSWSILMIKRGIKAIESQHQKSFRAGWIDERMEYC